MRRRQVFESDKLYDPEKLADDLTSSILEVGKFP
jgi:hypothetical protein